MQPPASFCIRCLCRVDDPGTRRFSPCCGADMIRLSCSTCGAPVADYAPCARCGASRLAPPCPACGGAVSDGLDNAQHPFGSFAWNTDWVRAPGGARCASCGHEPSAAAVVEAGHPVRFSRDHPTHAPGPGRSEVTISAGESYVMWCDDWDHRPTVEVRVARAVEGSGLAREERIAMTPEEWRFVLAQLAGPLRILLEQRPWWKDTT